MDAETTSFPAVPLSAGIHLAIGQAPEKLLQLISLIILRHPLVLLDCGNRSNMYQVAKMIRPYTADPVEALNRIQLSRAFTCIQVLAMLRSVLDYPLRGPVVVLDLLNTFWDEDVKLDDARMLLRNSCDCLQQISLKNPVIISMEPIPSRAQERAILADMLRAEATVIWEESETFAPTLISQPSLFENTR